MALIGKIREKSWLILIIVGGALLAFILTDYQKMTGNTEFQFGYGTVFGEKVDMQAFDNEVNVAQENADRNAAQQNQQPQTVDKSQVWTMFTENIVLEHEFEALGINVSDDEFDAYLYGKEGFAVMPELAQQFRDSVTGQFNDKLLQARIEELESSEDPEVQQQWEQNREYYISKRKKEKYFDILGQGMYVTSLEAKNEYHAQKDQKTISFILKRYSEIKDVDIDASEEKIKAFYEEHKTDKKYENKYSSRELRYFDLPILPSGKDSAEFNTKFDEIKAGFMATTNDSTYVLLNSELKFYSSGPYSTAVPEQHKKAEQHLSYPRYLDTVFSKSSIGDIVGPFEWQGKYNLAKVIGFTKDTINARHILLPVEAGKEAEAEARADSIMAVINSDNFTEYVDKYSTDQGSAAKGGELGDFFFSDMVQPFAVYCAEKPIGEIGRVTSQFGIHIIEVLDRKGAAYPKVAMIQKTLTPSLATTDSIDLEVDKLIYLLNDELAVKETPEAKIELFDTIAARNDHFVRSINIEEKSPKVYGFKSKLTEDKLLSLAYTDGAMIGDLINAPIRDENRYVIAVLAGIRNEGVPEYKDAEQLMKRDYIQEQKAKRFSAQMINTKSLTELEKRVGGRIEKAEVTMANPQITGAGPEPSVVGALFTGLKDGTITLPLRGEYGVYVVQVEKSINAPAAANYDTEKVNLLTERRGSIQSSAVKGLTKLADVVDNRRFFETNIRR